MSRILKIVIGCFFLLGAFALEGQVFLQLEEINQVKPYKFHKRSLIFFKTQRDNSTEWIRRRIQDINPKNQIISTFDENYKLNEITHFQRRHDLALFASYGLYSFGTTWLLLGVLGDIGGGEDFTRREITITGGAIVLGFIVKSLFYKQNYKIGKKHRLRIVDTNFY